MIQAAGYTLLLFLLPVLLSAQVLPPSTTPRGVVYAFLTETASEIDSIDRAAFGPWMTGEFGRGDARKLRGLVPAGWNVRIDSIPDLAAEKGDELRRVAAYVTLTKEKEKENWYLFCAGDSLWRIESLRRLPSLLQREQILRSLGKVDTTVENYRLLRDDLHRSLLPDDSLCRLLYRERNDVKKIVEPLSRSQLWKSFGVRDINFAALEEYRELDDDIDSKDQIFYTINRSALERLKWSVGLRRIERDERYPGVIFLVTGELGGDSFGYLYTPDPKLLPPVSRMEFITLKPAGPSWWLYKRVG